MQRKIDLGEDKNVFKPDASFGKPQASFLMEELPKSPEATLSEARDQAWAQWVNSDPLLSAYVDDERSAHLFFISDTVQNKVVLLDFFEASLLPSRRSLSYTLEWNKRYNPAGLVTIGVHSPYFDFGRDKKFMIDMARELQIPYPIVLDNNFAVWKAFEGRYWPRRVILTPKGAVCYDYSGEGDYQECERMIQNQLRLVSPGLACPRVLKPLRKADEPDYVEKSTTSEIYFGAKYKTRIGNTQEIKTVGEEILFKDTSGGNYAPDLLFLDGKWTVQNDHIHCTTTSKDDTKITINFRGTDVYMVAGAKPKTYGDIPQTARLQFTVDKKVVPDDCLGRDGIINELRKSGALIRDHKLHHLVSKLPDTTHEITFTFDNTVSDVVELYGLFFSHGT